MFIRVPAGPSLSEDSGLYLFKICMLYVPVIFEENFDPYTTLIWPILKSCTTAFDVYFIGDFERTYFVPVPLRPWFLTLITSIMVYKFLVAPRDLPLVWTII